MTSWLKRDPAEGPPQAPRVDLIQIHRAADAMAMVGPLPAEVTTILDLAPVAQFDRWGGPLPLSEAEQFRLDRLAAVIASPYDRTRKLLLSGELAPDEVEAVRGARPAVYAVLSEQATREMLETTPPFMPWADNALGVLFQRPAPEVYAEAQQPKQQGGKGGRTPPSTPAERREIAIRERR